ncbi:hypothetical protein BSL78_00543 [Apostichopus japonicus]|uniref:Uncharacterized protein n=1 Tax=Stichopus japonicus TaxID=307972 RepID=A0A2G8LQI8_STIJA|nr:hypothetical protein BSL78_00543 [Apostichopus japonicus]
MISIESVDILSPGMRTILHSAITVPFLIQHQPNSTYDRLFHVKQGYQCKLHRDDREHTIGLDVHGEESQKVIPVLSSSAYGHREALEGPCRQHARIERVMKGFYRTRGTNLPAYGMDDKKDCSQ